MMLAAMVIAQAATTVVASAPAFLIPFLYTEEGMSLAAAGLLAGAPNLGLVISLVAWGIATDRFGERRVILIGLGLTVAAVALSVLAHGFWALGAALVLSGALSACTNSASGRLITGWFPPERRGLAMGIRQSCQPIGIGVAAIGVPALAAAGGVPAALSLGGALTLVGLVFCALVVRDPNHIAPRADRPSRNPYRGSRTLVRIHAVSVLLVIPQFALSTFGLVWFTVGFGWSALAAGALMALAQLLGALSRVVVGAWSDRVASRLRPLRQIAVMGIAALSVAAAFGLAEWSIPAAVAFVLASCISVADNGLAFTAVAEIAGRDWSGRALGIQNTGQFLAAAAVGPGIGAVVGMVGVPLALAFVAAAPLVAIPLVPRESAHHPRASLDAQAGATGENEERA